MGIKIGHASSDENRKASGGKAGDQTGGEVCIRDWYSSPWDTVLRCTNSSKAEEMAKACEAACANEKIGYDQYQRNTLNDQAKKVQYKLGEIKTACECDCSSLMTVCAQAAGINVPYVQGNAPYTGNMKTQFTNTGYFEVLTASKYLTSDKYLKRGDILLRTSGHTAMALENGSAVTPVYTPSKSIETIAREVIRGDWGTGNVRKTQLTNAGYDYAKVQEKVNELLSASSKKSITDIAKEVIAGKWGNGVARKNALKQAGYDPDEVQKKVNELL